MVPTNPHFFMGTRDCMWNVRSGFVLLTLLIFNLGWPTKLVMTTLEILNFWKITIPSVKRKSVSESLCFIICFALTDPGLTIDWMFHASVTLFGPSVHKRTRSFIVKFNKENIHLSSEDLILVNLRISTVLSLRTHQLVALLVNFWYVTSVREIVKLGLLKFIFFGIFLFCLWFSFWNVEMSNILYNRLLIFVTALYRFLMFKTHVIR